MGEKEIFVGSCSKYIDGQGWTTEIPVKDLKAKGYYKCGYDEIKEEVKKEIAKTFVLEAYVGGKKGLLEAVKKFIDTYVK